MTNPRPFVTCERCRQELPRSAFDIYYLRNGLPRGVYARCRTCRDVPTRQTQITPNPDDPSGATVLLSLTKGKHAVIDAEDADRLSAYLWCAGWDQKSQTWTVFRTRRNADSAGPPTIYLHRQVMNAASEYEVDHKDGDRLNNSKNNLRLATRQQNVWNTSAQRNSTSKYRGVSWSRHKKRWIAQINTNNKYQKIGQFVREGDAARAYDKVAKESYGEFARLNFPEQGEQAA